jgi:hypothetical protein
MWSRGLIVAFLTFQATDMLNAHAIHLTVFDIVVEFLVNAIKLITLGAVVIEVDRGFAMAIDTPAHAQF